MIPKKIHYVWFGGKEYSVLIKKCMQSWDIHLPGFEFKLWNEENSPLDVPYVKRAIEEKRYAFASDYVRLYALYNEGGVYLDTDMEIVKDISELLDSEFFAGYESEKWISAGIIGSVKKNRILKNILDHMEKSIGEYTTIPKLLTKEVNCTNTQTNIYPSEYFYPYYPFGKENPSSLMFMDVKENTFAIHHWEMSWMEKSPFFVRIKRKWIQIKERFVYSKNV